MGARQGVCRDFAVLGYCARGLDCDKQHVRECPDFAEKGSCETKGCKLPHVIRANRNRKHNPAPTTNSTPATATTSDLSKASSTAANDSHLQPSAESAEIGDEYISLTFRESDNSSEEEEDSEEGSEGESEEEEEDPVESLDED